jgi:hypothetical protein
MYSDSEDVPQIRANLQEFLRLLKETVMRRIQDQDLQRAIIEFLNDSDPDYDPEFRWLSSGEHALGQFGNESEGVPTQRTSNWNAIRAVSGLDIASQFCFRHTTPSHELHASSKLCGG